MKAHVKRALFINLICAASFTFMGIANAQELQTEYELCLVSKFIDKYSSGVSVNSFMDVENLLKSVAPDCVVERYGAAFEHVEIMVDTNDLPNVNMREVEGEVEENTILDLSVELHMRMF